MWLKCNLWNFCKDFCKGFNENEKFLESKIWLSCNFNFFSFNFCFRCGVKTIRSRNITKIEAVCQVTNDSMLWIYLFLFLEKDAILPSSWEQIDFNHIYIWWGLQTLGRDLLQVCLDVMMMFILVVRPESSLWWRSKRYTAL